MSEATNIWVHTSSLEKAITGKKTKEIKRGLPTGEEENDDEFIDWGWAYATLIARDEESIQVTVQDRNSPHNGRTAKLPVDSFEKGEIEMGNKYGGCNVGDENDEDNYPDDLIILTHLHQAEVVHCLRKRYIYDKIYTATGPILLALNPFKMYKDLYSKKKMEQYWHHGENSMKGVVDEDDSLPPHVFGIADHSFRRMMTSFEENGKNSSSNKCSNQSILVSGESGAGKTVTTKFILQYLATLSQRSGSGSTVSKEKDSGAPSVEQQVLQSNPILESFGNARTIRNDNSSRFGKFIEIKFAKNGSLAGASIETYLLEKVRLVSQAEGERNYHIFYELFSMGESDLEEFHIDNYNPKDFNMTNKSGTYDRRDGVEDFETFDDLKKAMEIQGWTEDLIHSIMAIPAAALHGSNVSFLAISNDESELDTDCEHLGPFIKLMGLDKDALQKALCFLKIKAGREHHMRTLSREKAEKGMEALIKAFYGALFTFLVRQVNSSITFKDDTKGCGKKDGKYASIGVLDIFGFESFKYNSFEQLCINYCNEALQQQFNRFVLKNEQSEYEREGIEWAFISFPDNEEVLQLIDKKGAGILNILDDQCRTPGTSDKTFCQTLYKKCTSHPRFEANFRHQGANKFAVNHYAGPVEYSSDGFVEKNTDDLPKEASDLLLASSSEIVKELAMIISNHSPVNSPGKSPTPRNRKGSSKMTVGIQFSRQLKELRDKIDVTSPHYVRCLKPNDLLVPDHFNPLIISDQLRYAGVIEAIRVSRVGYPHRYTHDAFVSRYRLLAQAEIKKAQCVVKQAKPVHVVVDTVAKSIWKKMQCEIEGNHEKNIGQPNLVKIGLQVGKTKVFLRRSPYEIIEQLRGKKNTESATLIQKIARGYINQRQYQSFLRKALKVQCIIRGFKAKNAVHKRRCNYRSTVIQKHWRKTYQLRRFVSIIIFARWLQKYKRGKQGRRRYEYLNRIRKAVLVQKYWRCFSAKIYFVKASSAILILQCAFRCFVARQQLMYLKKKARDLGSAMAERDVLRKEMQILREQLETAKIAAAEAEENGISSVSIEELEGVKLHAKEVDEELQELKTVLEDAKYKKEEYAKRVLAAEEAVKTSEAQAEDHFSMAEKYKDKYISKQDEIKNLSANLKEKDAKVIDLMEKLSAVVLSEQKEEEEKKEMEFKDQELFIVQENLELVRQETYKISGDLKRITEERKKLIEEVESSISSKKAVEEELELERHKTSEILKDIERITEERDDLMKQAESSNSSDKAALLSEKEEKSELAKSLERITAERDKLIEEVESSNKGSQEELLLAKQKANEISGNLERGSKERNMLKEEVESLTLLKLDIPSVDKELSAKLDTAMETIPILEEKLRKLSSENDKPIRYDESVDLIKQGNYSDVVSLAEHDSAMATIRKLEEQLKNNKVSQVQLETAECSRVLSEKIDHMKKEFGEIQKQAAMDLNEKNEDIKRLKNELEVVALGTSAHNDEGRDQESHTNVQMIQEIQTLEDEVARLNRELADSKKTNQSAGEIDRIPPAVLRERYEELRRLSDALLDKDTLIMKLTTKLEKLEDYAVQTGGFPNGTEAIALRARVNELQSQLNYFQHSNSIPFNNPMQPCFQNPNTIPIHAPMGHELQHYNTDSFGTSARPGFQNHNIDKFSQPVLQSYNMGPFHTVARPNLQNSNTNQINSPTRSDGSSNSSGRNLWSIMHSVFDDTSEEGGSEEVHRKRNQFKETDLKKQLNLLRRENSTLKADSNKFCKKAITLENELKDERAIAKRELKSFAKTLRGVDELRTAAESMSRQVKKYNPPPSWNNALGQVDKNEVDSKQVQETLRMLSKSRAHFEQGQPSGFWKLLDAVAIMKQKKESHEEENLEEVTQETLDDSIHVEDIQNIKAAKRRRNKMKKQSSNNSSVSCFL